jgi:hypothetical protein
MQGEAGMAYYKALYFDLLGGTEWSCEWLKVMTADLRPIFQPETLTTQSRHSVLWLPFVVLESSGWKWGMEENHDFTRLHWGHTVVQPWCCFSHLVSRPFYSLSICDPTEEKPHAALLSASDVLIQFFPLFLFSLFLLLLNEDRCFNTAKYLRTSQVIALSSGWLLPRHFVFLVK